MSVCATCAVRNKSICGALPTEHLVRLNAIARHRHFAAGDAILHEGEEPDYFGNVISGVLKLSRTRANGDEQILGLQFASDFVGRPFRRVFGYDARAITPVHLCSFPRQAFEGLLQEFADFEHRLFEQTLDELDAARDWAAVLARPAARERLSSFLLVMLKRNEEQGCERAIAAKGATLKLPLSRMENANYLGLTTETVSRQFTQLKLDGIIAIPSAREIVILDLRRLQAAGIN